MTTKDLYSSARKNPFELADLQGSKDDIAPAAYDD